MHNKSLIDSKNLLESSKNWRDIISNNNYYKIGKEAKRLKKIKRIKKSMIWRERNNKTNLKKSRG